MASCVVFQFVLSRKGHGAKVTDKGFLSCVNPFVNSQFVPFRKGLTAKHTREMFAKFRGHLVFLQIHLQLEPLATHIALVWFLCIVQLTEADIRSER